MKPVDNSNKVFIWLYNVFSRSVMTTKIPLTTLPLYTIDAFVTLDVIKQLKYC